VRAIVQAREAVPFESLIQLDLAAGLAHLANRRASKAKASDRIDDQLHHDAGSRALHHDGHERVSRLVRPEDVAFHVD